VVGGGVRGEGFAAHKERKEQWRPGIFLGADEAREAEGGAGHAASDPTHTHADASPIGRVQNVEERRQKERYANSVREEVQSALQVDEPDVDVLAVPHDRESQR